MGNQNGCLFYFMLIRSFINSSYIYSCTIFKRIVNTAQKFLKKTIFTRLG